MIFKVFLLNLFFLSNCYSYNNYFKLINNKKKNKIKPIIYKKQFNNIKMISPKESIKILESINNNQLNLLDNSWSYNEFIDNIKNIDSIGIIENQNLAIISDTFEINDLSNTETFNHLHILKYLPSMSDSIIKIIENKHIDFQIFNIPTSTDLANSQLKLPIFFELLLSYAIFFIFFNIVRFIFQIFIQNNPNLMNGPMPLNPINSINAFKKSNSIIEEGSIETRFDDVAGLDEVKEELEEIVDFLKNSNKYSEAGAKIPKGVLLEGPPGTGKTLLARAVAGEAGVSFISVSGSEFIEMFVGIGAQRVRTLFKKARDNKPCVIFIDEIDAVGGKRGYGFNSGGNDEREQTLNQILTNMDGFDKESGIIVLGATNRADTLDPALKRAGRFDRKIKINLPDIKGRKEIALVKFKNIPNVTINYNNLAMLTTGFSGADLANLANEAILLKIKYNKINIDDDLIIKAFEKITIGLPKKYETRSDSILKLVAYHEIGHALMVKYFSDYFKLQKVSLNSNTGGVGGYTLFTPLEKYIEYPTKSFLLSRIIIALGGRAAEIVLYNNETNNYEILKEYSNNYSNNVTTGASSDLNNANIYARQYIELFENYVIEDINNKITISDKSKNIIDERTGYIINECLLKAINILKEEEDKLNYYSKKLINEKIIKF